MAKAKTLVCRFCGDRYEGNAPDSLSYWSHNHPAVCPYRQDRVQSLNGVHVGDVWRNRHTKDECVVTEIRLGGEGVYTDREPVIVFDDRMMPHPMWSLAEHWESVTRPGEWPVPWTRKKGLLWAHEKWRGPGYRDLPGQSRKRRRRQHVYWHSYHMVGEWSIQWERTNELWQMDPVTEERFAAMDRRDERVRQLIESGEPVDMEDVLDALYKEAA